ncbi:DUF938 domain-containing protein [Marinobacter nanhaiticus D15-8W]|uniref:DUF938 domain-containing protein n=1 Tax=Marinobacter nanhaiticus D15-8W TaxID=626887 RepID=N6VZA2_9GAMM|nr:DUF938 domain-containing protein [Marinobacter nanhaiticus D15-8W]
MLKPVAEACLRNQQPIAEALAPLLEQPGHWLELGSGTGQHGVFLAQRHPHITWQLTDVAEAQPGLRAWQEDVGLPNLPPPQELDVMQHRPPGERYDGVFTANTVHFVGWPVVEALLTCASNVLETGGWFVVYGPFNRDGQFTSEGNEALDAWLRSRDPSSGIKDDAAVIELAASYGLTFDKDQAMPANNRMLFFRKQGT